ncbi:MULTISPECIES: aspartyl/asparaginyl beta-hydroxylase domain-containing protein [unclassified Flavobacterium]|jgi:quercetin dioxygenase-like cupin family protein|uniref:aspartyl/asparaginyl beta-hydroxylase domain-containing protein n=1 Tax=unclassified Flavobacterium TaxID=196869 RepID=UPI00057EF9B2|nr:MULTISPECIES: aspartyl/asparaginyl beta-hydroxylase domain-containing protein [unclassified Flavobacterium]KIA99428.1 aspartyl beta-hydroxylase [Flavobacterium sp. KMS]MEA9415630.1 aspartyl/asparaginyl beta-hydroxylase domain-containing protein [Flavobacterium sp. PL02]
MDKLVRSIKFPLLFDKEKLKNDFQKIIDKNWIDHYNTNDYSGKWTSIALMSQSGKSDAIYAFSNNDEKLVATEILDSCTYFKEILDGFLFEKTAVRLLQLAAGAEIKPHSDNCLGYEDDSFRLHIPIITNSQVEFILDGTRLIMNEGECWYIDANFIHSVANRGTENRIHLVIDGIRNEWTDAMFYKEADKDQFVKAAPVMSEEQKQLMIAELKRMNTPMADELIKNLE